MLEGSAMMTQTPSVSFSCRAPAPHMACYVVENAMCETRPPVRGKLCPEVSYGVVAQAILHFKQYCASLVFLIFHRLARCFEAQRHAQPGAIPVSGLEGTQHLLRGRECDVLWDAAQSVCIANCAAS